MRRRRQRSRLSPVLGGLLALTAAAAAALEPAPAASSPAPAAARAARDEKKPLTEKQRNSGAFRRLLETTGASVLELEILYQTSGAEDFKEFSRALMVCRILGLDHSLVLRALSSHDLDEVLRELGIPEERFKPALKAARKELETAEKKWK